MFFAPLRKLFGLPARAARKPRRSPARFCPRVEGLEERAVPATLKVGSSETYHTIQSAVTAAHNGDTILIDAGTYNEQVTIPSTFTSLTLNASSTKSKPTIKPTGALSRSMAIVDVNGATGVTLENVVIDGSGTSTAWFGVFVENGGSATIQGNTIQNVMATANSGQDTGFGIRVGRSSLSGQATTGTATITGNIITGYGKGGIDVANTGSSAAVSGNIVTGLGHKVSDNVALVQNGIEIDDGATGTVSGNTITKNGSAQTGFGSAGVLLYNPGASVNVSGNTLTSNDVGIWQFGGTDAHLAGNTVTSSTYYGIATDSPDGGTTPVLGEKITGNTVSSSIAGAEGFDLFWLSGTSAHQLTITGNTASNNAAYGFLIGNLTSTADSGAGYFNFSGNTASNNGTNPAGNWTLATDGTGIAGATGKDGVFVYTATLTASGSGTIYNPLMINGNTASGNAGYGLNLQYVTASVALSGNATVYGPISISGNTASTNKLGGINIQNLTVSASGTGTATIASGTTISQNTASSNTGNGISFVNFSASVSGSITFTGDATVKSNNASSNTGNGYFISNSPGLSLDGGGSSTANSNGGDGLLVQNSNGAEVENYKAQSNTLDGIQVRNSQSVTIETNTVGGSSTLGNKNNGIEFDSSTNGTVMGNVVTYNAWNGILFDANSTGNTIGGTGSGQANTFQNNDTAKKSTYYDANDQTDGTGTLNNWVKNTIGTKNKSVLK